jgi:hypothetical protein
MAQLYDAIGLGYDHYRRPDPRIATAVIDALGDAATVVNVGAGAGSYEPVDRPAVAVEPSGAMISQRPAGSAPVVQASATHLPFRDATLAKIGDVDSGLTRLRGDLADGTWERRYGHLLGMSELDLGYRLVIARRT